ncbi:MAG: fibronectin type III domain-containing protein [bacterium]|nr:fibronectin type III domain-containing protein [bacterium]
MNLEIKILNINREHIRKAVAILTIMSILLWQGIPNPTLGATYTFTQTTWSGDGTANSATHGSNQSGWTEYSAKDSDLTVGTSLTLGSSASTTIVTDSGSTNTGFNISGASHSSTALVGTGDSASVKLSGGGSFSITNVQITDSPTYDTSISIGSDGFARIAYFVSSVGLRFAQCTNASCTTSNISTIDSVGATSLGMALGSDGFARISYYDGTNADLKYAQCTNASCSTSNITTLDSTGIVGQGTSIALGADGYARIAYDDSTNADLKFIQCTNDACTTKNTTLVDNGNVHSYYGTSIAMASDGFARISYYHASGGGDLKFVQCTNDACSTNNITIISSGTTDTHGQYNSLVLGADGYARISYYDAANGNLQFVQCTNAACSTNNSSIVDSNNDIGRMTSIGLGSDGFGRISYNDNTNGDLKYAKCTNAACSTSTISTLDSTFTTGYWTSLAVSSEDLTRISYIYQQSSDLRFAFETYNSSGTYTSGAIDIGMGVPSWGNLSWTAGGTGTITMKARSDADGDFSNATAWDSCTSITSGQALSTGGCVTDGDQYIQYQASLSTADGSVSPTLDDVTIGYNIYSTSATLTSSAYDSGDATNVIGTLAWDEDASLPSGTTVTVSLRTASASAGLTGAWTDFTNATANCTKTTGTVTCSSSAIPAGMKDGSDDRWLQYKITLTSTGANTPTVDNINVQYVVNAPPSFDATFGTNGISISQVSDSASADWGKIQIQYKIRDTDTSTGSANPGYVTPSLEYNIGGGWVAITSGYLASGDLDNKVVDNTTYNTYTATWDVKTQIPDTYYATAQIRVTLNDNEGANNTANASSATFALDTKNPTITTFTIDSAADTLSLNLSDDANISYRLSNDSSFTGVDWTSAGAVSYIATPAWTFTGSPSNESVYLQVRDIYGNTASQTAVAPLTPSNIDLRDTSNSTTGDYREFLSWTVYTATSSAAFNKYELYRSTDGGEYSLLTSITNSATNYYTDTSVATTSSYSYKVRYKDTNNDISNYSSSVSDTPDGQGGTDFTAPTITSVSAGTVQATWVTITWTTDELSNSEVGYSASPSTSFSNTQSDASYVTSHSVTVSGLTPNTAYLFRVRSTDVLSNIATDNNSGAGYSFTTAQGPTISDVTTKTVADQIAEITWNTNTDSDSYVIYSASLATLQAGGGSEAGSATLVGTSTEGVYQHNVSLSGLSERTKYYYYVKSTDASSNIVTDKNGGDYFSFTTTFDNKAPTISGVSVLVSTRNSAVIAWNTDENATSQIEYGTSAGTYSTASTLDSTLSVKHAVTLTGLSNNTTYYFRAKSKDAQDNEAASSESSFLTSDVNTVTITVSSGGGGGGGILEDRNPPKITNVKVLNIGAFEASISFDTDELTTGYVLFGNSTDYGKEISSSNFDIHHEIKLFGLNIGNEYHFKIKAQDKQGNFGFSNDDKFTTNFISEALEDLVTLDNAEQFQKQLEGIIASTLPSLIPPFITDLQASEITESGAVVSWSTNVPSYSSVIYATEKEYDKAKENPYPNGVSMTETKTRQHKLTLSNLSPATAYHYQASSFSLPGVVRKSADLTFTTKASKIQAEVARLSNTDAEIRWVTPRETSSFIEYRNAASGKVARTGNDQLIKNHSILIENLTPDTVYNIRAFGNDSKGNVIEADPVRIRTRVDKTAPVISLIKIDNALVPRRTDRLQTVVSWLTDEPANSVVQYEEGIGNPGDKLTNNAGDENAYSNEHIVIITSLKPSTVYRMKILSADESKNVGETAVRTILTPKSAETVLDIILKNFEESFGFLKNLNK